jgi:hypothetical protein
MSYFKIFFLLTFLILSSLNEISLVNKIKPTKVFKTILEIIEPTIASYENLFYEHFWDGHTFHAFTEQRKQIWMIFKH